MRVIRFAWGVGATLSLAVLFVPQGAVADTLRIDPNTFAAVGKVDDRFQSYNVEMAEVIGGRFWKPYAHMTSSVSDRPAAEIQVGKDPNLFEALPPVDLSNHRLRVLAAALAPAYVRVSGTWANTVYFQNDDGPAMTTPPDGYRGVLTRAEWRGVLEFAKAVDAKLVTSFTINSNVRDSSGTWTPAEARPLFDFTSSIGGNIYAAELFNEPNLSSFGGGPKGYDAASFTRDVATFRAFVAEAAPALRVVGPGDTVTANLPMPGPKAEDLLAAEPRPRFDIFSYHFYGAVSLRCAPPKSAVGTSADQALSEAWLARTDKAFEVHKDLRDRFAPGAPIWITETAQAACGGSPWAATFLDSFRYLDQMGRLAKQGASVVFHNTLAASEYGLIDGTTHEPRPNYWAALLWRRLMGATVLNADAAGTGLHLYAHCLRAHPGGVSMLAINLDDAAATIDVSKPANLYLLTSPSPESTSVLLNGRPLAFGSHDRLPELQPERLKGTVATLPPKSIGFIAIPRAANPSCR